MNPRDTDVMLVLLIGEIRVKVEAVQNSVHPDDVPSATLPTP
ncbi:MAG: hypothetical protein ACPHRO_09935 [Nannocystaceae bacterium]